MKRPGHLATFFTACLALQGGLAVIAQGQNVGITLQWRSESRNQEQLAQAMERLYVVLYNSDNLPTRHYADDQGMTMEAILRDNNLFFGAFFPVGIDSVMCDLNPSVCSRERQSVSAGNLSEVASHVGGYRMTPGEWSNGKGDVLNLPDLIFSEYTRLTPVEIDDRAMLDRLLGSLGSADCKRYGAPCTDLVLSLNPHLESQLAGDKLQGIRIVLPVNGVETTLTFRVDAETDATTLRRIPDELKGPGFDAGVSVDTRQRPSYDEQWDARLRKDRPMDLGIEALSPNIMSAGDAKLDSTLEVSGAPVDGGSGATAIEHPKLFELIHYPFRPNTDPIPSEFQVSVPVGVFDTWFDNTHCDLGANVEPVEIGTGGSERDPPNRCGELLSSPNVIDDHGTHVIGLISAVPNGQGAVGLNPFAKIKYFQVDRSRLRVPEYRDRLAEKLILLSAMERLKVVNMSWRYTNEVGQVDSIADGLEAIQFNTLVVAAAGNEGVDFNVGGCGERPACLTGFANLMTVIGLGSGDDAADLWVADGQGSNSSADFHIAAIAEHVVSTVYGGYVGAMSGTSQAAPQVTAAASLLYAIYDSIYRIDEPHLLPQRVKNRLMYTSDLFTSLLDKVKSGRLNVERALDVGRTRIVLQEEDGTEREYIGNLAQFGNDPDHELILCRTSDSDRLEIPRRDLRRMFYDKARQRYIVFRNRSGDRNTPLDRIIDCNLLTLSHRGVIVTANGPHEFQFWQLRDYVSPMFE